MLRHFLPLALLLVAAASAEAVPPEIPQGQYVRERDTGSLTVRRDEQGRLVFEIESVGANGHSCHVSGVMRGSVGHGATWAADGSDSKCDISFSADRSAMVVRPITEEECRVYCGARAGFDGIYRVPPATCTTAGRQVLRDQFLLSYRDRRYSQAASTLQSLISQCGEFMDWIETDRVRNDLALSQYHSGEFSQCLATLKATLAGDVKDEEALKSGKGGIYLPPADYEHYFDVAKSTLFNKALCTKAMSTGR